MKTKQEQIEKMVKIIKGFDICGLFGRCFSIGADSENTRYITCPECFAEALYNAGYGDVKQAQIDVLNKLKDSYGLYYLSAFGVKERMLADILNPMIEELKK